MHSSSRAGRRRSGMRSAGRLTCGWRRKSTKLRRLYLPSSAPSGTDFAASVSRPWASRGEWHAAQPRAWNSFSPWAAATASGASGAKREGRVDRRNWARSSAMSARSAAAWFAAERETVRSALGQVVPGFVACGSRMNFAR